MKTYKHLYEKFIDIENIKLAMINSSKGKRNRRSVAKAMSDFDNYALKYQNYAMNFSNKKHTPVFINDGISHKKRMIIVPTYDEEVIHHALINILMPIFYKPMYEHSYASIPNRGCVAGKKVVVKWIKDTKNTKYYLKMDIKKFYDSVPHNILKDKLRRIIKDEKFLEVLFEVIDVVDVGLPLGFYTSQWIANWYLTGLDHYIKENLKAKYYIRYMDDMVIFDGNKRRLHNYKKFIEKYLNDNLGLQLKENWQVVKFCPTNGKGRDLDFMGFRFYRHKTIMRKSIFLKMQRKSRRIHKYGMNIHTARQMMSYNGWLQNTDTRIAYQRYVKPYVNLGKVKRYISKFDRRKRDN